MNAVIAQSGGPTAAINASLAGVLAAFREGRPDDRIYGAVNGILGVMEGRYLDLTEKIAKDPLFLSHLSLTPAMFLGSCRYKIPEGAESDAVYQKIIRSLMERKADTFFYIGGNDSMDTVMKLSSYTKAHKVPIKVIGIPKTIDNDLLMTDHTPGFGSAAKYVASSVREIAMDAYIYAVKSVTIVEIMGRDAGWLTASSALARTSHLPAPHLIYLPEVPFSIEACLRDIKDLLKETDTVVIAVSEGIRDKDGAYISASDPASDLFGHNHLSGAGKTLEHIIKNALKIKVRSIEINVLQRFAGHLASLTDIHEAEDLGREAFLLSAEGRTGLMSSVRRVSDQPYQVTYEGVEVSDVADRVKKVPASWIRPAGNDVTDEMLAYLRPLIQGEAPTPFKDGLPDYLPVDHLLKD